MLREIANVHQQDAGLRRRWFCDDYFDIFVWEDADGAIVEFQLCYDRNRRERVLRWRRSTGFLHHAIDSGDASPLKKQSPIMVADGELPVASVVDKFDAAGAGIEPRIRVFLREQVLAYAANAEQLDKAKARG